MRLRRSICNYDFKRQVGSQIFRCDRITRLLPISPPPPSLSITRLTPQKTSQSHPAKIQLHLLSVALTFNPFQVLSIW